MKNHTHTINTQHTSVCVCCVWVCVVGVVCAVLCVLCCVNYVCCVCCKNFRSPDFLSFLSYLFMFKKYCLTTGSAEHFYIFRVVSKKISVIAEHLFSLFLCMLISQFGETRKGSAKVAGMLVTKFSMRWKPEK